MERGIVIIGAGDIGRTVATEAIAQHHKCVLHNVVDSQITEPNEVFKITRPLQVPELYIDPKEPVFNQHKHEQTCAKNRKKRKKRKRR